MRARGDRLGDGPFVEGVGSVGGKPAQGLGIGLVHQQVAGFEPRAVRPGEVSDGVGHPVFRHPVAGDVGAETRADDEALVREALGVSEQRRPRTLAVLFLGQSQHGHSAGNAGGAAADQRLDEGQRLAVGAHEHVGRGARRRGLAAVVGRHRLRAGVVVDHEGAAPEAGALGFDESEHRLHRHRRVGRRATRLQHIEAGVDRMGIGGCDHDLRARRLRRSVGRALERGKLGAAGQKQGGEKTKKTHGNSARLTVTIGLGPARESPADGQVGGPVRLRSSCPRRAPVPAT